MLETRIALNNTAPIDPRGPEHRELLEDLQCNILSSHGKTHTRFYFMKFRGDAALAELNARTCLGLLARSGEERKGTWAALQAGTQPLPNQLGLQGALAESRLKSRPDGLAIPESVCVGSELARVDNAASTFVTNALLTPRGAALLGLELTDSAFNEGQRARWSRLGDLDPDTHAGSWDKPYHEAHAVLCVAGNAPDPEAPEITHDALDALHAILDHFAEVMVEDGRVLARADGRPIEQFGFRDGISQPRFYRHNVGKVWSDFASLRTVLVPDPHGRGPFACGSYFAFRKLQQNVVAFHEQVRRIAAEVRRSEVDIMAEIIGRTPDGQPLVHGAAYPNDFDYSEDRGGLRCPGYAHIRKLNPRADLKPIYDAGRHRIVRRGLSYGPKLARDAHGMPDLQRIDPHGEPVGMLFLCAQADITEQFEQLQGRWASANFGGRVRVGVDAVVGPRQGATERLAVRNHSGELQHVNYASFVEFRGGEYLYAPSISCLKSLLG